MTPKYTNFLIVFLTFVVYNCLLTFLQIEESFFNLWTFLAREITRDSCGAVGIKSSLSVNLAISISTSSFIIINLVVLVWNSKSECLFIHPWRLVDTADIELDVAPTVAFLIPAHGHHLYRTYKCLSWTVLVYKLCMFPYPWHRAGVTGVNPSRRPLSHWVSLITYLLLLSSQTFKFITLVGLHTEVLSTPHKPVSAFP